MLFFWRITFYILFTYPSAHKSSSTFQMGTFINALNNIYQFIDTRHLYHHIMIKVLSINKVLLKRFWHRGFRMDGSQPRGDVITWNRSLHYWSFMIGVTRDYPHKWSVMRRFDAFVVSSPNKLFNEQLSWRWFETPYCSCDVTVLTWPGGFPRPPQCVVTSPGVRWMHQCEETMCYSRIHCSDVMINAMVSIITGVSIVYSTVCSGRSKKISKLRVTGLCEGDSPVTGEFSAQRASKGENVSIWWRHHAIGWSSQGLDCCYMIV